MEKEIDEILKRGRALGYPLLLDESVKFFTKFVEELNPKKILEIGTAIGYSGSLMLSVCGGSLVTLELNERSANIATENFKKLGFSDRVQVVNIDAKEYLQNCQEKFDFIFLDGPKGQYINYKEKLIDLLDVGGVLLADNVLFRGMVESSEPVPHRYRTIVNNMRKFIDEINNDARLETQVYHIGDGISVSKKIKN